MSVPSEADRLLALARRDLRSLGAVVDEPDFAEETFGFLAQQAVEKALKGLLEASGVTFPLTHDLGRLYALVPDRTTIEPYEDLTDLFPFAVIFRYSNADDAEPFDRQALHDRLDRFLEAVRTELARLQAP